MEELPAEKTHRRGPWSQREDELLIHLVRSRGPVGWVRISEELSTRTAKQCRERYHQNLKPTLNHSPITPEEGAQIERMVGEIGKRWAEIARSLNNRSDNAVKNWWNGSLNRDKRCERRRPSGVAHRGSPGKYSRHSPERELGFTRVSEPPRIHTQQRQARMQQQASNPRDSSLPIRPRSFRHAPTSPHHYHLGHSHHRQHHQPRRDRQSGLPSPSTPRLALLEPPPAPSAGPPPPSTQASSFFDGSAFRLPPLGGRRADASYEHTAPRSPLPPLRTSRENWRVSPVRGASCEPPQLPTAPSSPEYPQPPSPTLSPARAPLTARENKDKSKKSVVRIHDLIS